ncbi:hypothetical protein [Microbulbifer litoralis]|uniref:hypothetical protein n=1 Tax=Microbulbifer litoralis TaxID=2933965 RepID=UPI0020293364|nr:hypothetical protein [Microbulbifer sp. GX H0434]
MNLRFLCANHRQWLTAEPHRAEQAWLDWVERGASLAEDGSYAEAIPFLGCAFELADYLLGEQWPGYSVAAMRFGDSARQLMEAYRQRGEGNRCNYILVGASSRLARELANRQHYQITADCIRALYVGQSEEPVRTPWEVGTAVGGARLH